jgi:excisionase family DNA binding protein
MKIEPHPNLGAPLLTIEAAADWADVHPKTIWRKIKAGELEAHKVGSLWRIRPEDLVAYYEGEA